MTTIINKRITSTERKESIEPQYQIKNPFNSTSFLSDLTLIPDPYFTRYAFLKIYVGNYLAYSSLEDENFRNTQTLIIATKGIKIKQGDYLRVYLWNPATQDKIALTVNGAILRTAADTYLPASPVNELNLNQLISTTPETSRDTADITAAIQAVTAAVTAQTVTQDDSLAISSTLTTVVDADNMAQDPALITALDTIRDALIEFQNNLNQTTLDNLTTVITQNLQTVTDHDLTVHQKLLQALINIRAIRETAPSLRSADSNDVFPRQVYPNGAHTALLDLAGNRNMIIIIASSTILPPDLIQSLDETDFSLVINEPLLTVEDINPVPGSPNRRPVDTHTPINRDLEFSTIYDFGHPEFTQRIYNFRGNEVTAIELTTGSGVATTTPTATAGARLDYTQSLIFRTRYSVLESDSPEFLNSTLLLDNVLADDFLNQSILGSKRYVKVIHHVTLLELFFDVTYTHNQQLQDLPPGTFTIPMQNAFNFVEYPTPSIMFSIIRDLALQGGRARLFGEVRTPAGDWETHLEDTDFVGGSGIIGNGQSRTVEFGANTTAKLIPSSQDLFRLRLQIEGALEIGISVIRLV